MKKVLLATWYENHNYGTALQAYALKSIIENPKITEIELDFADENAVCEILPHKPKVRHNTGAKWKKALSPKLYLMKAEQLIDKRIYNSKKELFMMRDEAFNSFIKNNFNFASDDYIQEYNELAEIEKNYDYVISGSDQIWNPESLDRTYLLEWVEPQKKFSYGSSLSVKSIPDSFEDLYHNALNEFKCISIRDSACCKQLSEIVGKEVLTVVDPVVLLGRVGLLKHTSPLNLKPYMFCYFLGNDKNNRKIAESTAQKRNLDINAIINAGSGYRADKLLEPYADWSVDPWKFVSYIYESDVVITDSFHATVISVMLHKDFIVLMKDKNRPEQNNRILEFLNLIGLEERWGIGSINKSINPEQWDKADDVIYNMRKISLEYLIKAMNDE